MIVSVIVYEVLKLIRGTHAVQMAMGIALLVGLFYVSRGAQLETLNWLIRNVVGYVVFASVAWSAVIPLAIGCFSGSLLGPTVVRRAPQALLRRLIALAGLGLALHLGIQAYT